MAGNTFGGKRAAITIKERYGDDFYRIQGSKGGKKSRTGGFYANRELAKTAGRKGGLKSRRGKAKPKTEPRKNLIKQLMEKIDVRLHKA